MLCEPLLTMISYDPHGEYVKAWVPELRVEGLEPSEVFQPWTVTPEKRETLVSIHAPINFYFHTTLSKYDPELYYLIGSIKLIPQSSGFKLTHNLGIIQARRCGKADSADRLHCKYSFYSSIRLILQVIPQVLIDCEGSAKHSS